MTSAGPLIYGRFAAIYDEAYAFVDYAAATAYLRAVIRARHPAAKALLEVACGTGRYLELLAAEFAVEGVDISPPMLARASVRVPNVPLHQADMTDLNMSRRYDVVCCLFRSIAYLRTVERLDKAISAMARHLQPGGLLLIEPFFTPDTYWVDRVTLNHYTSADRALAWMYVSKRTDLGARLEINCLVGTPSGVEHFVEIHELGLYSLQDFARAFEKAGLRMDYDPVGPGGVGLYVGSAI